MGVGRSWKLAAESSGADRVGFCVDFVASQLLGLCVGTVGSFLLDNDTPYST